MTLKPRKTIHFEDLQSTVTQLVHQHDMLRTRFTFSIEKGWSQYVVDATMTTVPNVESINLSSLDALEKAILDKEQSLNLIDGPVYAVTLFTLADTSQYLQFTVHHTIVDLVSWRILIDDLEMSLRKQDIGSKTMSFKSWSEQLSAQAQQWDASAWLDYMGEDVLPRLDAR